MRAAFLYALPLMLSWPSSATMTATKLSGPPPQMLPFWTPVTLIPSTAALFLLLSFFVFYFKRKIYQTRDIQVPLKMLARQAVFPAVGLVLLVMYLCLMLPTGLDKCRLREYLGVGGFPFLSVIFFGVQPALIFYAFYVSERAYILKNASRAAFSKGRAWIIALNILLASALSVFLVFAWMSLTASTGYSFINLLYYGCN